MYHSLNGLWSKFVQSNNLLILFASFTLIDWCLMPTLAVFQLYHGMYTQFYSLTDYIPSPTCKVIWLPFSSSVNDVTAPNLSCTHSLSFSFFCGSWSNFRTIRRLLLFTSLTLEYVGTCRDNITTGDCLFCWYR